MHARPARIVVYLTLYSLLAIAVYVFMRVVIRPQHPSPVMPAAVGFLVGVVACLVAGPLEAEAVRWHRRRARRKAVGR